MFAIESLPLALSFPRLHFLSFYSFCIRHRFPLFKAFVHFLLLTITQWTMKKTKKKTQKNCSGIFCVERRIHLHYCQVPLMLFRSELFIYFSLLLLFRLCFYLALAKTSFLPALILTMVIIISTIAFGIANILTMKNRSLNVK